MGAEGFELVLMTFALIATEEAVLTGDGSDGS